MMVTGEGGILLTNDDDVFANVKQFSEHGQAKILTHSGLKPWLQVQNV